MSTKTRITSDFATPNDVASRLRIPAARVAELRRQLFDLHMTQQGGSVMVLPRKNGRRENSRKAAALTGAKKK